MEIKACCDVIANEFVPKLIRLILLFFVLILAFWANHIPGLKANGLGQFDHHIEGWISLCSFDLGNVGGSDSGLLKELTLCQTQIFSTLFEARAEQDSGGLDHIIQTQKFGHRVLCLGNGPSSEAADCVVNINGGVATCSIN